MSRDSATVSNNMRKIHSKDTSIELLLRKALWHKGYRYRKNYKVLPGSPDIVLTKYKIAIFCDSEFFHGKDWEILRLRLEKGKFVKSISGNFDSWINPLYLLSYLRKLYTLLSQAVVRILPATVFLYCSLFFSALPILYCTGSF